MPQYRTQRIKEAADKCLLSLPGQMEGIFADDLHEEGYSEEEISIIIARLEQIILAAVKQGD
jgi:spore germination protein GerM